MKLQSLSVLGALAMVSPAFGITVNVTDFFYSSALMVDLTDSLDSRNNFSTEAGEFKGTIDASTVSTSASITAAAAPALTSFTAYCGELSQNFFFKTDYTSYVEKPGASVYTAQKTADLSRLFTAFSSSVVDNATSAAMQAGIWEIIYEQGPSYSLTGGNFKATPQDSTFQNAFNQVNGVLGSLSIYSASYRIDVLQSPDQQDFVIGSIPEPGTWALYAGGLAVMGFMASRKRRS